MADALKMFFSLLLIPRSVFLCKFYLALSDGNHRQVYFSSFSRLNSQNVTSQGEVFILVAESGSQDEMKKEHLGCEWEPGKWTCKVNIDSLDVSFPDLIAV